MLLQKAMYLGNFFFDMKLLKLLIEVFLYLGNFFFDMKLLKLLIEVRSTK